MEVASTNEARRIEAALRAVLPPTAGIKVHVLSDAPDQAVEVDVAGGRFRARWVGAGWLRQVRQALSEKKRPDLLVASRMSPGARELLTSERIGWVDELGAAEIATHSVVVSKTGRSPEPTEKSKRWTDGVLAIAEALLCKTAATVSATTAATGLSHGTCTNALRMLSDLGLLTTDIARGRASARRITNEDQLLDAYATAAAELKPKLSLTVGVSWRDTITGLKEVGRQWNDSGMAWAATGVVAANMQAPFLTTVSSAEVYVAAETAAELDAIATKAGLRPIDGGRLTLAPFPTVSTRKLATELDSLRVAPWPRVFADLRAVGVRGEDAAEHLREVMHGK